MAHKKLQATAELFLNTKNAKKDAQIFIDDLKQKLTDMESAADKMTVFKDMVGYIGKVDKALSAMRANNKDAFDKMFGGLDANLKKQLEGIFGIDGAKLSQLDVLRDALSNLTPQSTIKEIRAFAKSLNDVYESIGLKTPFSDIESEFKEFSKEAKIKHIDALSSTLTNFATVWKDVNSQISKGFGFGHGVTGGVVGLSDSVQREIDKLKQQEEKLQEIVNAINDPKKVKVQLMQNSDKQVEQLQALKNAFLTAADAKKQLESNKMTGTQEYLGSVAMYIKSAAELKAAFESSKLTKSGNDWIMSSGLGVLQDADNVLNKFFIQNKDLMNKVVDMYDDKLHAISGKMSFLEKPYDTLMSVMSEYADLQDKMNHEDRFSDNELNDIDSRIQSIEKYLLALDQLGDKKDKIQNILSSVTFDGMKGAAAAEELCRLFSVEIPNAVQKADAAIKSINDTNVVGDGDNVMNTAGRADDIIKDAQETVDAIDYAKKELVKAWKSYHRAAQRAAFYDDIVIEDGETSPEMDKIKSFIDRKLDSWGITATNASKWGPKFDLDLTDAITDGDIGIDEIEREIDKLIKQHGISFNIPIRVEPVENSSIAGAANRSGVVSQELLNSIARYIEKNYQPPEDGLSEIEKDSSSVLDSFKELVNYISQSGNTPSKFFDKLESGAQVVDGELKEILQALNLIDEAGNVNLSSIKSGYTNKGGFVSDQYTMIARLMTGQFGQDYLGKAEALQQKLQSAKQAGAQIGAIFDLIKDEANGVFYEIQNTVPGTAAFSHHKLNVNADVLNASQEQLTDLVHTIKALTENGLFIDFGGDNILYDKDKGFSIIDLGVVGNQHHTVSGQNTLQENLDRFIHEYFKFAPSSMHTDVQTLLADTLYDIAQGVDSSVVNPNGKSKTSVVDNAYNRQDVVKINNEEVAHEQNTEAINAEAAALEALIQLKEKAQNMKWKDFAKDESLSALKDAAGFTSISQLEKFWKQARYDKDIDFHEISVSEAKQIFANKLPHGLANKWYGPQNFSVKDQLENEILQDDEIRNAALNYMYYLYQNYLSDSLKNPKVKNFKDFLNTEFTLYRGDDAPLIYGDESKMSFSFSESKAKSFSSNIGTVKAKPKDTIGNAGSHYEHEVEIFGMKSSDTSWFKQTNETFEDFYNKQTKEMQNEINAGLINLEKQRVRDLLDDDVGKLVHQAGKDQEFQSGILKSFQRGDIPDLILSDGSGSIHDQFVSAYNSLSDMDKKLVAYFANLESISKSLPEQFSISSYGDKTSKRIVGKDAALFNAILNDPTGVQKYVGQLTGESKFGIVGQNAHSVNVEANMHKLNAQAIEEERQAQVALNKEKEKLNGMFISVSDQLHSDADGKDSYIVREISEIWDGAKSISKTYDGQWSDPNLISKGGYVNHNTGEISKVKDLINKINEFMSNTGMDLSYVQDYISEIYKNADINEIDNVLKSYYDITSDKLKRSVEASQGGSDKFNKLASVWHSIKDVNATSKSDFSWLIDKGEYENGLTGEVLEIEDLYNSISEIEQRYGENLQYVKDYLDSIYKKYEAHELGSIVDDDISFTLDEDLLLDLPYDNNDNYNKAYANIIHELDLAQGEQYNKLNQLENHLIDMKFTSQEEIDSGFIQKSADNQFESIENVYALIEEIQQEYSSDLSDVKKFLDEAFATYSNKNKVKAKKKKYGQDAVAVTDYLMDQYLATPSRSDIEKKLYKLMNKIPDVGSTPQSLIDSGKVKEMGTTEIYDVQEIYDLINSIQSEYKVDLDNVKEYLDKTYQSILKADEPQSDIDELVDTYQIKQKSDRLQISDGLDGDTGVSAVSTGDYALETTLQQTNDILGNILAATQIGEVNGLSGVQQESQQKQSDNEPDQFELHLAKQTNTFNKYKEDLESVEYVSRSLRNELDKLGEELQEITTQRDLNTWVEKFNNLKDNIYGAKSVFEQENNGKINLYQKELSNSFSKLTLPQREELYEQYSEVLVLLNKQKQAVEDGKAVELSSIKQITAALQEEIDKRIALNKEEKEAQKTQKKNAKFGDTAMINASAKYNALSQTAQSSQFANSAEVSQALQLYTEAYEKMNNIRERIRNSNVITDSDKETFKSATNECNEYAKALDKLIKNSIKLHNEKANPEDYMLGADFIDNASGRREALTNFAKEIYGVSLSSENFKNNFNEATFAVKNSDGTFTRMTARFTEARNEIVALAGDTKKATSLLGELWNQFTGKVKSIFTYLTASFSLHQVWSTVKQGVQYVREIDASLTELKKVTDESDASYRQFLKDMSKTGAVIGSTVKDLTSSAADWARLGYSMKEAGELAKNTSILMNVSEFTDVSKATDTLISSLQAFKTEGQEVGAFSMDIIDKYNEVGNNYAISTSDLAESLTRSSAALVAANNSLEQSIALTAAANTTIQDPESVGNALKVVSMRIRGVKSELENAGEDTEGMVENTAKLQEKIMALTNIDGKGGINILTETGEFKSTYDVLLAISKIWKEMDDTSQAALLELIAGKTRGSVVAALFQNGDVLEDAYNSATGASGSAMQELETYLDSIQGRVDLFNNSLQTMWMNFIDSETIKDIVDLGTAVIKLVDSIGLIPAAVGAFVGFKTAANSIKKDFKAIDDGTLSIINVFKKKTAAMQADTVATDANTDATNRNIIADKAEAQSSLENAAAQEVENNEKSEGVVVGQAEEAQDYKNVTADKLSTQENLENAASQEVENNAQRGGVLQNIVGGVSAFGDIKGTLVSGASKFGAMILGGLKGVLVGSIVSLGMSLVGELLAPITDGIKDFFKSAEEKAKELKSEVEELKNTYKNAKKTFDDDMKTLTSSSDTKLYNTLEDEFETLAKGVDKYGNNISLTSDQYERYKDICEQIVSINPKIASGYDSATKAIGNNADALSSLIELQKIQQIQNAKSLFQYDNVAKIAQDVRNDISSIKKDKSSAQVSLGRDGIWSLNGSYENLADRLVFDSDYIKSFDNAEDAITSTLQTLGYTDDNIKNILSEYQNGLFGSSYDSARFFADYMREIYNNIGKFNVDGNNLMMNFFDDTKKYGIDINRIFALDDEYNNIIDTADSELEEYMDGLVDYLLQVPYTRDAYYRLNDGTKSIIAEWIKNSELFKIDTSSTASIESQFRSNIALIQKLVDAFADDTIQTLLTNVSDIDDTLLASKYGELVNGIVEKIWIKIGGKDNQFGLESKNALLEMLGIDFDTEANELAKGLQSIQNYLKTNGVEANVFDLFNFDTMTREEVKAFLGIDWNAIGAENVKNVQDVWNIIRAEIAKQNAEYAQTYSALSDRVSTYNDVLSQTAEIVANNTQVTQEYKDSLIELGISEKELNACFDESNPLIVKNADALNDLVKATKNNIVKNAQLAKAQSRLQYYDLYKEIRNLTNGVKVNDDAMLDYINSLYDQMDILEKTIKKYSILEAKLLGASNAYNQLENAQSADEEMDYGSKAEEFVNILGDAIHSRELGTEAAQVAIEALIPDSVLENLTTADEKMDAIYKYFTKGTISQLFTIEFDDEGAISSVEMTEENLKKYINSSDVFDGSWDKFTLNESINSMEDFMNATDMTREMAFAFFTELEKYDISWLNGNYDTIMDRLMGDDFDYQLQRAIDAATEVEKKLAEGSLSASDREYMQARKNLELLEEDAIANVTAWQQKHQALTEQKKLLIEYQEEYERALIKGEDTSDIENNINAASKQIDTLIADLRQLDEPTTFVLEVALSESRENLNALKDDIDTWYNGLIESGQTRFANGLNKIMTHIDSVGFDGIEDMGFSKGEDGTWQGNANITGWIELDNTSKAMVLDYISMLETEHIINLAMGTGEPTLEENIKTIAETLAEIAKLLDPSYEVTLETTEAENSIITFKQNLDSIEDKEVKIYTTFGGLTTDFLGRTSQNGASNINGTAYKSGSWGAQNTETALTGEVGPELLVRGNRWSLVGEDGSEFTQVKRGDIIFNHKQTEELLKNGSITGRGKAYANGTTRTSGSAYAQMIGTTSRESEILNKAVALIDEGVSALNGVSSSVGLAANRVAARNIGSAANQVALAASGIGSAAGIVGAAIDTWNSNANLANDYGNAGGSGSSTTDEFEETIDWIEVRLEELDETLSKLNAELENAVGYAAKNNKIDAIIAKNREKLADLKSGADYYEDYAQQYYNKIDEKYREMAKNGAIEITEFAGDASEAMVEAIQSYRDYTQKASDLAQQAEEVLTEIRDLAIQKIDNAYDFGSVRVDVEASQTEKLQNAVDFDETRGLITDPSYYAAMMENSKSTIRYLTESYDAMQAAFNEAVEKGEIVRGSNEWYENLNKLYQIQSEIDQAQIELEEFQNAINDIYWDNFDKAINRIEYLSEETQSLINLMDSSDMFDKLDNDDGWTASEVKWTKEGLAALGLHAQEMERAEEKAKMYALAIDDLTEEYHAGHYSESEYYEKLNELTQGQYDAIEAAQEEKDAIVDLHKARVDEIKNGINKQIEAYEKLIEEEKKALDSEKDLYEFQRSIMDQQKNIAEIERKLAALSGDNSASARAQRAKLQAELYEARADLQDAYYDRSISDQQEALDKQLEDFQEEKDKEIEQWEKYLEDVESLVAESLGIVKSNADEIGATLTEKATEYNLTVSEAITSPWADGASAIDDYTTKFGDSASSTIEQLETIKSKWQEINEEIDNANKQADEYYNANNNSGPSVADINKENAGYAAATKKEEVIQTPVVQPEQTKTTSQPSLEVGSYVEVKPGTKWYSRSSGGGSYGTARSGKIKYINTSGTHAYNIDGLGWIKKTDIQGYAKGTSGVNKDQLAWIDEMGLEELVLHADGNGKLAFLSKGSAVVPHDISENLMKLGQLDPSIVLDQNRPQIAPSKSIVNTEIRLDCSVGTLVNIEHCDQSTLPDVEKLVNKAFDKHMQTLNNSIKRFTR